MQPLGAGGFWLLVAAATCCLWQLKQIDSLRPESRHFAPQPEPIIDGDHKSSSSSFGLASPLRNHESRSHSWTRPDDYQDDYQEEDEGEGDKEEEEEESTRQHDDYRNYRADPEPLSSGSRSFGGLFGHLGGRRAPKARPPARAAPRDQSERLARQFATPTGTSTRRPAGSRSRSSWRPAAQTSGDGLHLKATATTAAPPGSKPESTTTTSTTTSPSQRAKALDELARRGQQAIATRRNSTIVINGRKFDQLRPIECVDADFYQFLMRDLNLVETQESLDSYGTYYDPERAKAISSIIELIEANGADHLKASAPSGGGGGGGQLQQDGASPNSGGGANHADSAWLDESHSLLRQIGAFWNETKTTYSRTLERLNMRLWGPRLAGRRRRSPPASDSDSGSGSDWMPRHQRALENHYYLMRRLEGLKSMLLNGEESIILLNTRIKKLQQAAGQLELQQTLANCIASRAGRASLMLINELFNDRHAGRLLEDLNGAQRKAHDVALDAAEFCAFWYGDSLRAQALTKERQIRWIVLRYKKIVTKTVERTQSIKQMIIRDNKYAMVTVERHTKLVISKIIEMTRLWLPSLTQWIELTLGWSNGTTPGEPKRPPATGASEAAADRPKRSTAGHDSRASLRGWPYAALDASTLALGGRSRRDAGDNSTNEVKLDLSQVTAAAATTADGDDFETRTSKLAAKSAIDGFHQMLDLAYEQNALLYDTSRIKANCSYIRTLKETFLEEFAAAWVLKRDYWANQFRNYSSSSLTPSASLAQVMVSSAGPPTATDSSPTAKSVDEQLIESVEWGAGTSAYERGARLGYTLGAFVGDKAVRQWPDPLELNTFTYDSLFLAGIGHQHTEWDSKALEHLIVSETAKRVAFVESNRQAFARSLHAAYLSGASLGPKYGVLHGQRLVAKQCHLEGAQVGYEAASQAAHEFAPKAIKFLNLHEHQRKLAAPFKQPARARNSSSFVVALDQMSQSGAPKTNVTQPSASSRAKANGLSGGRPTAADKWAGFSERVEDITLESELYRNISSLALDCGQRTGSLMGTLLGLIVVPEAYESYTRLRGSLEALRNEFYQYKLGAIRGYELGESWAILNYTSEMANNLESMRATLGVLPNSNEPTTAANSTTSASPGTTTTTTTTTAPSTSTTTTSTTAMPANGAINSTNSSSSTTTTSPNKLRIPSDSFGISFDQSPEHTNVNNLFQFMVTNYGRHLIANHTSKSMLTIRSLQVLEDNLLLDMKIQSGDLIEDPKRYQAELESSSLSTVATETNGAAAASDSTNKTTANPASNDSNEHEHHQNLDELNHMLGLQGKQAGQLIGKLKLINQNRTKPIKLEIVDLGPLLEFADETARAESKTSNSSGTKASSSSGSSDELETIPLSVALSKVDKIYIKLRLPRPNSGHNHSSSSSRTGTDELKLYLNSDEFEPGDGFLCGALNLGQYGTMMTTPKKQQSSGNDATDADDKNNHNDRPKDDTTTGNNINSNGSVGGGGGQRETRDELDLESILLDELYERIEHAPKGGQLVSLTESMMRVTTIAPKRIESLAAAAAATSNAHSDGSNGGNNSKSVTANGPMVARKRQPNKPAIQQHQLTTTTSSTTSTSTTTTTTSTSTTTSPTALANNGTAGESSSGGEGGGTEEPAAAGRASSSQVILEGEPADADAGAAADDDVAYDDDGGSGDNEQASDVVAADE